MCVCVCRVEITAAVSWVDTSSLFRAVGRTYVLVWPSTRDASLSCNKITYNTIHIICHAIINFYTEPFETNSLKILIVEACLQESKQ